LCVAVLSANKKPPTFAGFEIHSQNACFELLPGVQGPVFCAIIAILSGQSNEAEGKGTRLQGDATELLTERDASCYEMSCLYQLVVGLFLHRC
jgi:hypothetical protein